MTDAAGSVVERMSYDSFGDTPASPRTRYTFTGRERDEFTGLYYYRARWYDAVVGRFISEDPIGFEGGDVNLYGYVKNNPMNATDPSGLQTLYERQLERRYADPQPSPRDADSDQWWRDFRDDLFIHRRGGGPCKSWGGRWWDNFRDTNMAVPGLFAPGLLPGLGLGNLTAGAVGRAAQAPTVLQWATNGFRGMQMGAAAFTPLETGITVAAGAAVNSAFVSIAYEGGVAVGSAVNATFPRQCDCP